MIFQLLTLVDITATGVTRAAEGKELERNQQRNFETVLQVLGLRTQPQIRHWPTVLDFTEEDVRFFFGEMYTGPQRVWKMDFSADHPGAYALGDEPLANLEKDFEQVPVITGLRETARFILPIFHPGGAIKNIHLIYYPNIGK
jgi:hypothetical protein